MCYPEPYRLSTEVEVLSRIEWAYAKILIYLLSATTWGCAHYKLLLRKGALIRNVHLFEGGVVN